VEEIEGDCGSGKGKEKGGKPRRQSVADDCTRKRSITLYMKRMEGNPLTVGAKFYGLLLLEEVGERRVGSEERRGRGWKYLGGRGVWVNSRGGGNVYDN